MKIKFYLVATCLVLCGLLMLNSCKKDKSVSNSEVSSFSTDVSKDVIASIKKMGFRTDGVLKTKGGYIVEGDIFIAEKDLGTVAASPNLTIAKTEQYKTYSTILSLPRVITVTCNMGAPYDNETDLAIARYNALNLRLTFQRVASGGLISITGFNSPPSPDGQIVLGFSAGFPTGDGNPSGSIQLNTNASALPPSANTTYVVSVIQHELGHAIGFRHTDYMDRHYSCNVNGQPYGPANEGTSADGQVQIPGTPSGPDANSFMLACNNGVDRPFNANDIIALTYLYGGPNRTVYTIASGTTEFPNVFLRMDGRGLTQFSGTGGGVVNTQYGALTGFERFYIKSLPDGTYSIESLAFPNIFLRMDANSLGTNTTGGTVNAQYGPPGPTGATYEKFLITKNTNGTYTITSTVNTSLHLRLDGRGVTQFAGNGAGVVNITKAAPQGWESFTISPALF
jgi:hypothetical protein